MKKNDVYKIIGYNGEYNQSVKKAIRKLLKENHPDNKGNREVFELVNEVKKELESGKVVSVKKEESSNDNLDYEYYDRIINKLTARKNNLTEQMLSKKKMLSEYEQEYSDLYHKNLDLENSLLANQPNRIKNTKELSIVAIILIIVILTIAILENNSILFIILIVLSMLYFVVIQKDLSLVHKLNEKNKRKLTSYVKLNNDIKDNLKKQSDIKKDIREIKRKIINVENDLRFYKNLLK